VNLVAINQKLYLIIATEALGKDIGINKKIPKSLAALGIFYHLPFSPTFLKT